MLPVAQLMHDDVVENFRRCQKEKTVEVQIAFGAAASPAGFLAADRDIAVVDAYQRSEVGDALRDHDRSSFFEISELRVCQCGNRISLLLCLLSKDFGPAFADPVTFFAEKALDIAFRHAHGRPHDDSAV